MEEMKKGRKHKWKLFGAAVLSAVLFCAPAACGKEQAEPNVPIQDLVVEYPLDNMSCFTAAKDGTVYQVNMELTSEEEAEYKLHRFNAEGKAEEYISLKDCSMVEALAVSEDGGHVYFTAQNSEYGMDLYLFSYSTADGSLTKLCDLTYFSSIKQLAVVGDVVYMLGISPNWQAQEPPNSGYGFSGERLVSYSVTAGEQAQLGFDFPISMAADGDGTLVVLGYRKGDGYCLMKYDPAKDSLQVLSCLADCKFDRFAICGGKDVVYDYRTNPRGLVLSDIHDLSVEAELYPDTSTIHFGVLYAGGNIYCRQFSAGLISFPLDAVQRDNKELSFLTGEYNALKAPYGCGYRMEKLELSDDKFALKVLARDADYDLCIVDTFDGSSGNLCKNGVFYPLNDVPGIEEYFGRCFPYVREAATREDGTIWMLPIEVDVFSIASSKGILDENGLSLDPDMTWAEYAKMFHGTTKEQREKISVSAGYCTNIFVRQYFSRYHTLEGEVFEESARALSEIYSADCDRGTYDGDVIMEGMKGVMRFNYEPWNTRKEDGVVVGMPKLKASDKNSASCVFLAVNPDSKRRDEALAYLADLIAYMMRCDNVPYFSDTKAEGALETALHEVYADGEIVFAVDYDIYEEGLDEMIAGKISLEEYIKRTEPKLKMYWGE